MNVEAELYSKQDYSRNSPCDHSLAWNNYRDLGEGEHVIN